jgi:tripartite-type tricarboxylate transporter receptor subunit TctC
MAPPGVPEGRATALRRAFDKTMKDEGFLAEAKQLQLDVEPTAGEEAQKIVQSMYATPKAVVERAKKLLSPN